MQKHAFQMSNTVVCLQPESKAVCTFTHMLGTRDYRNSRRFSKTWPDGFPNVSDLLTQRKILDIRHTLTLLSQLCLQSKDWRKKLHNGAFQGGHVRLQTWNRRGPAAFQWRGLSAIFLIFPKRFWAGPVRRFTPVCFIFVWSCYDFCRCDAFSELLIPPVEALASSADETCSL